jgi:hypothetical protein
MSAPAQSRPFKLISFGAGQELLVEIQTYTLPADASA